eukprot:3549537-Pleurochrysis_carterae.AAC.4
MSYPLFVVECVWSTVCVLLSCRLKKTLGSTLTKKPCVKLAVGPWTRQRSQGIAATDRLRHRHRTVTTGCHNSC